MPQTSLTITGTHCASCQALIEEVAREVPGVTACTVDFHTGRTVVEHAPTLDWSEFRRAVEALGQYRVELPPPASGTGSPRAPAV